MIRGHAIGTLLVRRLVGLLLGLLAATASHAAGTLTPVGAAHQPIRIADHHVRVVITNGFAQTEVTQTFHNPNDVALEALYGFPLPKSASLSELTITAGERELHGEVVEAPRARQVYRDEQAQGRDAGLATKEGYQRFEFAVARVPAGGDVRIRFLYYQPLTLDTGVGRYIYPLEEGNTDDRAAAFWLRHETVDGPVRVEVEFTSSSPVADVRVPGFEAAAQVQRRDAGHWTVALERTQVTLDRDFVLYYRLEDDLPGRVELLPYRPTPDQPGTFMLVLTPGIDLKPLDRGADYVFVLDISGSMAGAKLRTQAQAVGKALAQLGPDDRFRIVTFATDAAERTRGWTPATPEAVEAATRAVEALAANGSTNLFAGLGLGLRSLDADRATAVLLLTDGVTNTGVVDPPAFEKLLKQHDVRVFGFLIGNSANWPLMRLVTEASGGFYAALSNADDVIGQVLLAKAKLRAEALHDAKLTVSGVKVFDTTDGAVGKVYRGQQLVVFGRYERGGRATLTLKAALTGEDKTYTTTVMFPDVDTRHPELQRLWALHRIEAIEHERLVGRLPTAQADAAIRDLGLTYQLVTDHTAMVVLSDESFEARGIQRRNRDRIQLERQAQAVRTGQSAPSLRVDQAQPMFPQAAPSLPAPSASRRSLGGGAVEPVTAGLAAGLAGLALWRCPRRRGPGS